MAEQNSHHSQEAAERQKTRKRRRKGGFAHKFFFTLGTLILVFAITCSFLACFAAVYIKSVILPQAELDVADFSMNLSSTIYYTDPASGEVLEYENLHGLENRVWIPYYDIPKNLVNAAIAIEDRRFREHHGVDWLRTAKSVITMLTGGTIQGGSTITQQLIKNLTTYDDVTVKRKIMEIFRALEFDKKYSKDYTMEWYLNYIYFGRRCYGVSTAAYEYFGKDVRDLTLAECASLISITNNPSYYDPYVYPENNKFRQNLVLNAMHEQGFITEEELISAKAQELVFQSIEPDGKENQVYDWYTEQVISDVIDDLMEAYGYSERAASDLVYSGGLEIYACVDPRVQKAVESIYSDAGNLPYTSPSGQKLQSAIVIVDQQGNVAGLAGKMGQKDATDTRGWNRASRSQRQPGSTIKPIAVYAPALEMGMITPYSTLEDSPPMLVNGKAWPNNVNFRFNGMMTVNEAVTHSTNTIAVRVLQMVTPEVSFEFLINRFGIDPAHLVRSREQNGKVYSDIGYSQLALGGLTDGVSVMDMAGAYSVFPRNGIYVKPRTYSKVVAVNVEGEEKELLRNDLDGQPVLKEGTVYYINEMLKSVVSRGSGTGAAIPGMTVAGKTGSADANNDRWFVGYTPYYTAAVWVGYDIPERVKAPGNPAATLFSKTMSKVHNGLENRDFSKPELVKVSYCMDSGMLATELCSHDLRGSRVGTAYLLPEDVPTEKCKMHVEAEICTGDPVLKEDGTPTGLYHIAGEFCPDYKPASEDSGEVPGKRTVSLLEIEREYIGGVRPNDDGYLLSRVQDIGTCTVHTEDYQEPAESYEPSKFDITDPSTWPSPEDDPLFDPGNPSTWPSVGGHTHHPDVSVPPSPGVTTSPGRPSESEPPAIRPTESHPPEVMPTSAPAPEPTPEDKPDGPGEDDVLLPPGA